MKYIDYRFPLWKDERMLARKSIILLLTNWTDGCISTIKSTSVVLLKRDGQVEVNILLVSQLLIITFYVQAYKLTLIFESQSIILLLLFVHPCGIAV